MHAWIIDRCLSDIGIDLVASYAPRMLAGQAANGWSLGSI